MITDLSSLLAPASARDLESSIIGRQRLFARAADRARFAEVLPWPAVNMLFSINAFKPGQVRITQASAEATPAMYRDTADWSRLNLNAVQDLARQGASVVINGIDQLVPSVTAVVTLIERHLRCRTWANAYLSFQRRSAFKPHWDGHDVLILQLHGRKHWRSYGLAAAYPIADKVFGRDADPGPVAWEGLVEPGDVLFLPRGEVHAAELQDGETSAHLTIGLMPPRGTDVLRRLADGEHEEVVRMDVLALWSEERLREHEAALKAALHRLVDRIDLRELLAAADRRRDHVPAVNLGVTFGIGASSRLRPAVRRRLSIQPSDPGFVTAGSGESVQRLSAAAGALLDVLQSRETLSTAEAHAALPALAFEDVRRAASELAQKGLIYVDPLC